jgi:putative flippase GtrA
MFSMNAGISTMYFLNPLKSFTDKSSTKCAFISYLANQHRAGGGVARHLAIRARLAVLPTELESFAEICK